jgi:hypothetical protein
MTSTSPATRPVTRSWPPGAAGIGEALEEILARHNRDDRPDAHLGPSVSVGDVVLIDGETPFGCAPVGWEAVALAPGTVERRRTWRQATTSHSPPPTARDRGRRVIDDWSDTPATAAGPATEPTVP